MEKVAIYLRVSTNNQKFDSQLPDLRRWIENNRITNEKWYKDKSSGLNMERLAFIKLMKDVRAGYIHNIVIWRLDRLGRTALGLIHLFEDLKQYKCNLISLKDNLDLETASGRFTANILASVSNFETEVRGERVKSGQEAARIRGKRWGGSKKGHIKSKTKQKLNAVIKLHRQGVAKAEISRVCGLSIPTIYSILRKAV